MTGAHEKNTELTRDKVEKRLAVLEGEIQVYVTALSDLRDKRTHFRKDMLDLRAQIRVKNQDEEKFETMFKALRAKEESHKDVKNAKSERDELALELNALFVQYKKQLDELEGCCRNIPAMLDENASNHALMQEIDKFKAILDELQQAVKEPSANYESIVIEHLQVLINAARDLFNSVSWDDCAEGMNAVWQSLKTTFDGLLGMAKSLYPASNAHASPENNVEYDNESGTASEVSLEDDLDDVALDEPVVNEKKVVPLTSESVDKEIIALFDDLLDIRDSDKKDDIKPNAEKMQRAIKSLLIQAKKQPEFKLTPIQHAALHELRAEAGRNLFEHGVEGVKKQAGTAFASAKEAFKKWAGENPDEDKSDDHTPKS